MLPLNHLIAILISISFCFTVFSIKSCSDNTEKNQVAETKEFLNGGCKKTKVEGLTYPTWVCPGDETNGE